MNADQLSKRVNEILDRHWHSEPGPAVHNSAAPCDVCLLLTALETAVARHWDPIRNCPVRSER